RTVIKGVNVSPDAEGLRGLIAEAEFGPRGFGSQRYFRINHPVSEGLHIRLEQPHPRAQSKRWSGSKEHTEIEIAQAIPPDFRVRAGGQRGAGDGGGALWVGDNSQHAAETPHAVRAEARVSIVDND